MPGDLQALLPDGQADRQYQSCLDYHLQMLHSDLTVGCSSMLLQSQMSAVMVQSTASCPMLDIQAAEHVCACLNNGTQH